MTRAGFFHRLAVTGLVVAAAAALSLASTGAAAAQDAATLQARITELEAALQEQRGVAERRRRLVERLEAQIAQLEAEIAGTIISPADGDGALRERIAQLEEQVVVERRRAERLETQLTTQTPPACPPATTTTVGEGEETEGEETEGVGTESARELEMEIAALETESEQLRDQTRRLGERLEQCRAATPTSGPEVLELRQTQDRVYERIDGVLGAAERAAARR